MTPSPAGLTVAASAEGAARALATFVRADRGTVEAVAVGAVAVDAVAVDAVAVDAVAVEALAGGHIHRSFLVDGGVAGRFVVQWVNTGVFRDPLALAANVGRACALLRDRCGSRLAFLPGPDGVGTWCDADGDWWRVSPFLEGTVRADSTPIRPERVRAVAEAFGAVIPALSAMDPPPIDVIPRFHDLAHRVDQLDEAIAADACGRVLDAADDIAAVGALATVLADALDRIGPLPVRVVHNDAKLANARVGIADGADQADGGRGAVTVLDLDTVMRGTAIVDLGELLRSGSHDAPEDAADPGWVTVEPERVARIVSGWTAGVGALLTDAERRALPLAGPLMAALNGVRFLADHLRGDTYFAISRPGQNLDRARVQVEVGRQLLALG